MLARKQVFELLAESFLALLTLVFAVVTILHTNAHLQSGNAFGYLVRVRQQSRQTVLAIKDRELHQMGFDGQHQLLICLLHIQTCASF